MMIKITAARRTALHAAVYLCVYYFFIFNHTFKLLPYVALALAAGFLVSLAAGCRRASFGNGENEADLSYAPPDSGRRREPERRLPWDRRPH